LAKQKKVSRLSGRDPTLKISRRVSDFQNIKRIGIIEDSLNPCF